MNRRLLWSLSLALAAVVLLCPGTMTVFAGDDRYDDTPEYLYYIEGTGAYFLPHPEGDTFFHLGRWYRRNGGSWSTSRSLRGSWSGLLSQDVPRDLADLPDDFRATRPMGRIPYRYVADPGKVGDHHGGRYYPGHYLGDYDRRGYGRRWHPVGGFWFFVAPEFHDEWDDDGHRRKGRGRR